MSKPETVRSLRKQIAFWAEKLSSAETGVLMANYTMTFTIGHVVTPGKFCLKKQRQCKLSMFSTHRTIRTREKMLRMYLRSISIKAKKLQKAKRLSKTKIPFYEAKISSLKERIAKLEGVQFVLES